MKDPTPIENDSRFSERILQRELDALKKHITGRKWRGGSNKNRETFDAEIKELTTKAKQLEDDLEFLVSYRGYLKREKELPPQFI
jgi:hypothetical protein